MSVNLLGSNNAFVDFGNVAVSGHPVQTVFFIIKTAASLSGVVFVSKWSGATQPFTIQRDASKIAYAATMADVSQGGYETPGSAIATSTEYRVACRINGDGTMDIFVNGTKTIVTVWYGAITAGQNIVTSGVAFHVGKDVEGSLGVDGDYSHVAAWTDAKPDTELTNMTGVNHYSPLWYPTNGLLYARMGNASALTDEFGANNGTNSGGTDGASDPTVVYPTSGTTQTFDLGGGMQSLSGGLQ